MGVRFLAAFMQATRDRWQEFRKVYWKRPIQGNGLKYETYMFQPIQSYYRLIRKVFVNIFNLHLGVSWEMFWPAYSSRQTNEMQSSKAMGSTAESQNENKYAAKHPEQNN